MSNQPLPVDPIAEAHRQWVAHGWGEAAIVTIVSNGKTNTMPAHEGRLTPQQIHVLGAYVWSLSNQPAR